MQLLFLNGSIGKSRGRIRRLHHWNSLFVRSAHTGHWAALKENTYADCNRAFNIRTGTAYEGIHQSRDNFNLVADGISNVRRTAKIAKCSTSTVVRVTNRAGNHSRKVADRVEQNLCPEIVQFDEMTYTLKK